MDMTDTIVKTKLRPEVKEAWVAALRSGEYQQGRNVLRNEDGKFCCLGVLCDLANKEGVGEWGPLGKYVAGRQADGLASQSSYTPPQGVLDWAFDGPVDDRVTTWEQRTVMEGNTPLALYSLNDGYGAEASTLTFAQIADIIEAEF